MNAVLKPQSDIAAMMQGMGRAGRAGAGLHAAFAVRLDYQIDSRPVLRDDVT